MTLTIDAVLAEVVQTCLHDHLADPTARLADLEAEPAPDRGYSGNPIHRVRFRWTSARNGSGAATWVLKQWLPGGPSERLLGLDRPLEVLGWEAGVLRPDGLPAGVSTPIIGARRDPDGSAAWIVMEDVSEALGQYSRTAGLPPAEALARVKVVLDRLARFHSLWERPERQARLAACPWLLPIERFLWCDAASCAVALGRVPPPGLAPGSEVTDEYRANLAALLAWIPASDRRLFERLTWDREPLVAELAQLPRTLLHGDLDDRNIGLRPAAARAVYDQDASTEPDLVLIDWEWLALGTPALDVARVWALFPAICDGTQPCPEAVFSGELLDFYLDRHHAHGGRLIDPRSWRQQCALVLIAQAMSQVNFIGSMLRHAVTPIAAMLERQLGILLEAARTLPID